jgi:hypothetical protein
MKPPVHHRWFNYDRWLLPNALLAALERNVSDTETARTKTGLSIGHPGWGAIYYMTVCAPDPTKPAAIVETGTTGAVPPSCLPAPSRKRASRERCARSRSILPVPPRREHFARAGLADSVVLHEGDSRSILPKLVSSLDEVSVAVWSSGRRNHSQGIVRTIGRK